ncbi:MAG: enolase C-terminal domain-like protein [Armatimonadota bacterium]
MNLERLEWIAYEAGTRRDGRPNAHYVLRVTAEGGLRGWSFCQWPGLGTDDEHRRAEHLLTGIDLADTRAVWDLLWEGGVRGIAQSMIDMALWDLRGRAENRPVHELLGTKRHRVPAYVSSHFNVGGGAPEAYAEEALSVRERGFHGYKVHPTHGEEWERGKVSCDLEADLAIASAVRSAIGDDPDFALMWDNYHTYSYPEAVRVGHMLEDLGYLWYESPMWEQDQDMDDYVRLCRELDITICAPEVNDGAHMSRLRWMEAGACDMSRIDFQYGGLTSCLEVARACGRAGMALDLHTGHYMHLQVMGATTDRTIPYLEHYASSPSVQFEDGRALVPESPGLSLEPDWDYIEAHRLE